MAKRGLLGWLFRSRSEPVSQEDFARSLNGGSGWAGIDVDRHSAIGVTAVWACVRLISETLASLPLKLYRKVGSGKEPAAEHPLYRLMHDAPNAEQTSFLWREQAQGHVLLQGNTYSQITRANGLYADGLWPLDPERMKIERRGGKLAYVYTGKDRTDVMPKGDVLHIPGLGWDGAQGYPVIAVHAQAIGSSIAGDRYAAEFFGNSASPDGFISMKEYLKDKKAQERMQTSWEDAHSAWGKKHRTAILEGGAEWKPISIPPEQAQFIETRKYHRSEVASIFRVPPHLIGDVDRSTSWGTGIEQQTIGFVVYTMMPWLTRWEQSLNQQLLLDDERDTYFFKFELKGLLRGDLAARQAFYHGMLNDGVFSADDVLALEDMNEQASGQGKVYLVPVNMQTKDRAINPPEPPAPAGGSST